MKQKYFLKPLRMDEQKLMNITKSFLPLIMNLFDVHMYIFIYFTHFFFLLGMKPKCFSRLPMMGLS